MCVPPANHPSLSLSFRIFAATARSHLADEALCQLSHLLRELRGRVHDLIHAVELRLACKRWEPDDQLVRKHAHGPGVDAVVVVEESVVLILLRQVLRGAAKHLRGLMGTAQRWVSVQADDESSAHTLSLSTHRLYTFLHLGIENRQVAAGLKRP